MRLIKRNRNMKETENIPEILSNAGKKLPFAVPDSYFENLPGRIRDRMEEREEVHRPNLIRTFRPVLAAAAIFLGVLTLGYAGFRILTPGESDRFFSGKEGDETLEYFAYDLDEDLLVTAILESETDLLQGTGTEQSDELIQFLSEEDIDLNGLLNDQ